MLLKFSGEKESLTKMSYLCLDDLWLIMFFLVILTLDTSVSVATLPPFSPIEGQKWFDQISSQWESQKNRFSLIYFGKIQFLPPCIWNLPFMSAASDRHFVKLLSDPPQQVLLWMSAKGRRNVVVYLSLITRTWPLVAIYSSESVRRCVGSPCQKYRFQLSNVKSFGY
jgi:hypothetical protein